jgi:hypothetical protein
VINSGKEVSAQHFLSSTGRQQVQNNNAEELEEALIKALGNND